MKSINLFALTIIFAMLALVIPAATPAAAQGGGGRIAYDRVVSGNYDIWSMNPDGSDRRNITNSAEDEWNPSWSPDGSRLAFVSDRAEGNWDIYVINVDGSGLMRLTDHPARDSEPAWSPDGSTIAFVSRRDGHSEIYAMNADGSNQRNLSNHPNGDEAPAWSPDGRRIAFQSTRVDGWLNSDIFIMAADGTQQTNITNHPAPEEDPSWSPDGSMIAFVATSGANAWNMDLFVRNLATEEENKLVDSGENGAIHSPVFSPDGTAMAMAFNPNYDPSMLMLVDAGWDICVGPTGGNCVPVTQGRPLPDENPDWWWPNRAPAPANPAPAPAPPSENARCFEQTGFCIDGRIREYWEQNGGLDVFGLPITPLQVEQIEGKPIQVQWFERNRLELHPENPRPYDVLLGRLGVDTLALSGYDWQSIPRTDPQEGCYFEERTGRNICGDILTMWQSNGLELDGRSGFTVDERTALFGLPITNMLTMTTTDGSQYQVQVFERARFELHPENPPPFHVQLGLLGREVLGN